MNTVARPLLATLPAIFVGEIPWSEVRRVLDACEDPDVRIHKITFAVWPPRR